MKSQRGVLLTLCVSGALLCQLGVAEAGGKKKKPQLYGGKTVDQWVGQLIYSQIDGKKKAMSSIRNIGEAAVQPLMKKLNKNKDAFYWCASALGDIGAKSAPAVPLLVPHLADKDERSYAKAYETLRKIGPAGVPYLVKAMTKTRKYNIRVRIVTLLGNFGEGGKDGIPALIDYASSKDRKLKSESRKALARMRKSALKPLIAELNNKKTQRRLSAAETLMQFGANGVEAIPALKARYDKERKKSVKNAIAKTIEVLNKSSS